MEATKDHIGLETAKLLEGCGVESEYSFVEECNEGDMSYYVLPQKNSHINDIGEIGYRQEIAPAYTWQEILWEHAEKFFGEGTTQKCTRRGGYFNSPKTTVYGNKILLLLQQKKYDEADEYFRENCVFIKNCPHWKEEKS